MVVVLVYTYNPAWHSAQTVLSIPIPPGANVRLQALHPGTNASHSKYRIIG